MQSGCQSNDVESNALATIDRAEKSDVTKIQREAIGTWGAGLACGTDQSEPTRTQH